MKHSCRLSSIDQIESCHALPITQPWRSSVSVGAKLWTVDLSVLSEPMADIYTTYFEVTAQ